MNGGNNNGYDCDLMVVGAGVAGMAAALFASDRGLSVALAGSVGGIDFTTGLIDVLGAHPVAEGRRLTDPWAGLAALRRDCPGHPYTRVEDREIRDAVDRFTEFLGEMGLPFAGHEDRNARVLTAMGTAKTSWRVPRSMWQGVLAMERGEPGLIVDFHGLKGFSARQAARTAQGLWPGLRHARVGFPGCDEELYLDHMAGTLADPEARRALAEAVRPHLGGAAVVGFPAALGRADAREVRGDLERLLGVRVFEIPTMPPSQAGWRMRAAFDRGLPPRGVRMFSQKMVLDARTGADGRLVLGVGADRPEVAVRARAVVLASGRFFGKGLRAGRDGVRETVFGLPVTQPGDRAQWHRERFYDRAGHPLNACGIETDGALRPLGANRAPLARSLFAAGAILAHQDWMREKCGTGLAVATAYKAVAGAARHIRPGA